MCVGKRAPCGKTESSNPEPRNPKPTLNPGVGFRDLGFKDQGLGFRESWGLGRPSAKPIETLAYSPRKWVVYVALACKPPIIEHSSSWPLNIFTHIFTYIHTHLTCIILSKPGKLQA